MQESYREGIANYPGPEPCEGSREAVLEALDRGICRLGIELRKRYSRMPMVSDRQKATRLRTRNASAQAILRSRRPQACRETGCPLGARDRRSDPDRRRDLAKAAQRPDYAVRRLAGGVGAACPCPVLQVARRDQI